MNIIDAFKNNFLYADKHKTHSEAIIISCYFNPQNNPYRLKAFNIFYDEIKHLNHRIIECLIDDAKPQLPSNENIKTVKTTSLLWHKETLLNNVIKSLDKKYKYIFWLDADVVFTNKNWLVDGVKALQTYNIIQPFEYCFHLDQDDTKPNFEVTKQLYLLASLPELRHPKLWRSFGANCATKPPFANSSNYDQHGHVGFAWGARREVLDAVPLYDKALVGGADHIIAHAAYGQIGHSCIAKSFTEDLESVNEWSLRFNSVVQNKVGYVKGDLYHIWHGDLKDRQYLKRIKDFTPVAKNITERDANGFYVTKDDSYVRNYFGQREIVQNDDFLTSAMIGYATDSAIMGQMAGGSLAGGMVGEMLRDENKSVEDTYNDDNQNFS